MSGKRGSDKDSKPHPGLQPTSLGPGSTSNLTSEQNSNQRPNHLHTYVDQFPLNLGSQSSQRAPTLTSANTSSIANGDDPYQRRRNIAEDDDNNENNDRKSVLSSSSYSTAVI
jgi:hypothetical protein